MESNQRQYLKYQNQQKIDLMDPMMIQFLLTVPERKKYDVSVKKKLESVSRHLRINQYSSALQSFTDLRKDLLAEQFWQQWGRIDLQLRIKTITSEFLVFFEELKQERKQKQKLESEAKTRYVGIFIKEKSVEENKTALLNLLSTDRLKLGLELTQRISQFNVIGQLIKEILEYRWLISRHEAYNLSINNIYAKWRYQEMCFKEERSSLKAFIDQQYRTCDNRSKELRIIQEEYFRTKQFYNSFDLLSYKFNKETIKQILESHFYQYEYVEWFNEAQRQLVSNKVLEENYSKGRQDEKIPILKNKIDEIIQYYFQAKSNEIMTKKNESKLQFSTAKSSIVVDGIEITQDQLGSFIYKENSVKEIYQKYQVLMERLQQSQEKEEKMKDQIYRMNEEITGINAKLVEQHDIKERFREQNNNFRQKNIQLMQQLSRINEKINKIQSHIDQQDQESISLVEDESYVESILPRCQSTILQDEKTHLINIFANDMPLFTLQRFQKIFQYPEVRKRGEISQRLADCMQGRNHLLFVIKLAKSNKLISAFIERGFVANHGSVNGSQILQLKNLQSQISHRDVQSDFLLDRNNSSVFTTNQETLQILEKGFIIAHWKNQKFIPSKNIHLLKVDHKFNKISIGKNDLVINLQKNEVKSSIGKKVTAFKCAKLGRHGQQIEGTTLFEQGGAESGIKFQRLQIFHLKFNNDVRSSFKKYC